MEPVAALERIAFLMERELSDPRRIRAFRRAAARLASLPPGELAARVAAGTLTEVARLNAELEPLRILTGIEVDILADGTLDQDEDVLAGLDVVIASAHSALRMEAGAMTRRLVRAVANPRVDVLGHVTGRLITGGRGKRPESTFDAELVFEACATFDVAVEINSRPERRDPPTRLLELAVDVGCLLSIDSDAHAPGQLDLLDHGAARAQALGIPRERIVNTRPAEELVAWSGRDGR